MAEDLLILNKTGDYTQDFKEVFKLIDELSTVYKKSYLDLNNIETVFGAIEMGGIINSLASRTGDQIEFVRKALINLIVRTLDQSIKLSETDLGDLKPDPTYKKFCELLIHDGLSN